MTEFAPFTDSELETIRFGTHQNASSMNAVILDFESNTLGHLPGFQPLEIAARVVNQDYEVIGTFESKLFMVEQGVLDNMNPYVTEMHTKTGLLQRLSTKTQARYKAEEIDRMFAGFIAEFFPKKGEVLENGDVARGITFGGNSVAGVDIPALQRFMPLSYSLMDYTPLDASAVRKHLQRVNPQALLDMPAKQSNHTAMVDIDECIKELAYYRQLQAA